MIVRRGQSPSQVHDYGACPGRRLASPGIADLFGYAPIAGRLVRPEPEPESVPSMSLGAQRMRALRERQR